MDNNTYNSLVMKYLQGGAGQADAAAAAKMRRPYMPGINYAQDPNVQFERGNAARMVGGVAAAGAAPFLGGPGLGAVAGPMLAARTFREIQDAQNANRSGRRWMQNP